MAKLPRRPIILLATLAILSGAGLIALYADQRPEKIIALVAQMDPATWGAARYIDPRNAGEDFLIQGEYAAPGVPWGVQVVARGEDNFEARILPGGLPGAGANPSGSLLASGRHADGSTLLRGPAQAHIRDGTLTLEAPDGSSHVLQRTVRRSPTLGAAPPPGARVLFTDAKTNRFTGDIDAAGHLMEGALSLDSFGDFRLHLEFRTPFEPSLPAQKRGNSGVYIQKSYEVQVLDSFGLEGSDDECGALYKFRSPDVNMALPPLQWQTYDIDFTAARFDGKGTKIAPARISVRHNGVLTHDDIALPGPTGAGVPESADPRPLLLQDHGNPVRYRNVWIVPGPTQP